MNGSKVVTGGLLATAILLEVGFVAAAARGLALPPVVSPLHLAAAVLTTLVLGSMRPGGAGRPLALLGGAIAFAVPVLGPLLALALGRAARRPGPGIDPAVAGPEAGRVFQGEVEGEGAPPSPDALLARALDVEAAADLLGHRDAGRRLAAVRALGAAAPRPPVLRALVRATRDEDVAVRKAAIVAVDRLEAERARDLGAAGVEVRRSPDSPRAHAQFGDGLLGQAGFPRLDPASRRALVELAIRELLRATGAPVARRPAPGRRGPGDAARSARTAADGRDEGPATRSTGELPVLGEFVAAAWARLGEAFLTIGRDRLALGFLDRACRETPRLGVVFLRRAEARFRAHDLEGAVADAAKALSLGLADPEDRAAARFWASAAPGSGARAGPPGDGSPDDDAAAGPDGAGREAEGAGAAPGRPADAAPGRERRAPAEVGGDGEAFPPRGRATDDAGLRALLADLEGVGPGSRARAFDVLVAAGGERVTSAFAEAARRGGAPTRVLYARYLARAEAPRRLERLTALLDDPEDLVREEASQSFEAAIAAAPAHIRSAALLDAAGGSGFARVVASRWLADLGETRAVPRLADNLADRRREVRLAAVEALRRLGDPAPARTLGRLAALDAFEEVRFRALDACSALSPAQGAIAARRAILDPSPRVRQLAVCALARGGPSSRAAALVGRALAGDVDRDVRAEAARRLPQAAIALEAAIPPLVRAAARDPEDAIRQAALAALDVLPGDALVRGLGEARLLDDGDAAVRAAAARALGRPGLEEPVSWLLAKLADDPAVGVRMASAAALGEIGDRRAWTGLEAALADEEPVRATALAALCAGKGAPALGALEPDLAVDPPAFPPEAAAEVLRFLALRAAEAPIEPDALGWVAAALKGPDPAARVLAARVLGESGGKDPAVALDALLEAVARDPEPVVVRAAGRAAANVLAGDLGPILDRVDGWLSEALAGAVAPPPSPPAGGEAGTEDARRGTGEGSAPGPGPDADADAGQGEGEGVGTASGMHRARKRSRDRLRALAPGVDLSRPSALLRRLPALATGPDRSEPFARRLVEMGPRLRRSGLLAPGSLAGAPFAATLAAAAVEVVRSRAGAALEAEACRLAAAFAETGAPVDPRPLRDALAREDGPDAGEGAVRAEAARALGRLRDREAIPDLVVLAVRDGAPAVVEAARGALAHILGEPATGAGEGEPVKPGFERLRPDEADRP